MKMIKGDIDIDFPDRNKLLSIIPHVPASRLEQGELKKHNTGIYFQDIPINPISNIAAIDFQEAESRGYFKLDFLNVNVYKDIRDEEHLLRLMNKEPEWELLTQKIFVDQLFHLKGHSEILKKNCPNSVEQLAAVLSMIRPAKHYLIGKDWTTVMKEVWTKSEDGEYGFKKSHSIAYALLIVVQMNLICENGIIP